VGVRSGVTLCRHIRPGAPHLSSLTKEQALQGVAVIIPKGHALQASKGEKYCQSVGVVIPIELPRKEHYRR